MFADLKGEGSFPTLSRSVDECEQAPALDAGRHCNALNYNAGGPQKVINIARRFTRGALMHSRCVETANPRRARPNG
jgi:hypothetical protein